MVIYIYIYIYCSILWGSHWNVVQCDHYRWFTSKLHHKPQVYIIVICNWILELSLQVINDSDYTHTALSTGNENVCVSMELGS